MRLFIAIEMPQEIKAAISDVVRNIGRVECVRWVPETNMHLTLKFLGEVKEALAQGIIEKLKEVAGRSRAFQVEVAGFGAFPNLKRPNVLWVGMGKSEPLKTLAGDVDGALAGLGFERETRPFSPHLTIGRVKDQRGIEPVVRELSTYKDTFFGTISVDEILLMKSVLKPSGAEYSKAAVIRLQSE
jgi:2'-5' RNA ligase